MKKALAILSMLIIVASLLALGCAGPKNANTPTPTATPGTPTDISSTPTAAPTLVPGTNSTDNLSIDPSFADISNESDESLPEDGIPTPDSGQ